METLSAQPIKILVVEDCPINQKVMVRMLRNLGYVPDVVGDGRQALECLQRDRYDLVLMDIQLPTLDGYEATRAIRTLDTPARDTVVVALTATDSEGEGLSSDNPQRQRCLDAGMNDYLTKPISKDRLAAMLQRWS
jgi:CheY-like chemotaxis protein